MGFTTDKQTLDDLAIFGRHGSDSIFTIFNKTATVGGAGLLEQIFRQPLSSQAAINNRVDAIRFFNSAGIGFPFQTGLFDTLEQYLLNTDERSVLSDENNTLAGKFSNLIAEETAYKTLSRGVMAAIELLQGLRDFTVEMQQKSSEIPFRAELNDIQNLLSDPELLVLLTEKTSGKLPFEKIAAYDVWLRFKHRSVLRKILQHIYLLDVYISVGKVAKARGFVFPLALDAATHTLRMDGIYHPLLKNARTNTLHLTPESNIVFLTGANMAGKSTFMKTLGVVLFLAHMGFPVPARKMEFAVRDGILTTINLSDNLNMGVSHFYAEVLRVKKMAVELSLSKNLFIIFDELFRGTNVKDAYEATIALTGAFAQKQNCMFVVSTHIIEAGDVLKKKYDNINFVYLPTKMNQQTPVYTYQLETGITADRHGMIIINNEGILEILEKGEGHRHQGTKQKEGVKGFTADKQTLEDLNLLGKFKQNSIFSLFNRVQTRGGEKLLDAMFRHPLTEAEQINTRSLLFAYFQEKNLSFPISRDEFLIAAEYLEAEGPHHRVTASLSTMNKKFLAAVVKDEGFEQLQTGIKHSLKMFGQLRDFLEQVDTEGPYATRLARLKKILQHKALPHLPEGVETEDLQVLTLARYDYLLRHVLREDLQVFIELLHELDVFMAVGRVSAEYGFCRARALPKSNTSMLSLKDFRHPSLKNGVANSLSLDQEKNVLFLTGANMAGKSTLMKSFGVNFYLAHMGFPVAAGEMLFSVKDGLFSSINVSDNLDLGISHFYAEVLRVKKVAEVVRDGQDLLVIFDELFKGTNVKDAYDATLAVTGAFAQNRNCFFVISTHIIEVGETLKGRCENLQFYYLPTVMEGAVPHYPYTIKEGITSDKHGMLIIKNEGIMEVLN